MIDLIVGLAVLGLFIIIALVLGQFLLTIILVLVGLVIQAVTWVLKTIFKPFGKDNDDRFYP